MADIVTELKEIKERLAILEERLSELTEATLHTQVVGAGEQQRIGAINTDVARGMLQFARQAVKARR